jgi:hypothetical protein
MKCTDPKKQEANKKKPVGIHLPHTQWHVGMKARCYKLSRDDLANAIVPLIMLNLV